MKQKTGILAILLICTLLFSACSIGGGNTTGGDSGEQRELQQNDYRGAVFRTLALQKSVLAIIDEMKGNNQPIRQSSPNAYWTNEGYQDFVMTFLSDPILFDTSYLNEEQLTNWDDVVKLTKLGETSFNYVNEDGKRVLKSGYQQMQVVKNEKDDYSITGITRRYNLHAAEQDTAIAENYRVLYDCDKDWAKAYATATFTTLPLPDITTDLFEYRRLDENRFLIQTTTERLYVVLHPAADGTESLSKRTVKEFAYSRLTDGTRTTFTPYTPLPEVDENGWTIDNVKQKNRAYAQFPDINETGDVAFAYGKNDSLFLKKSSAGEDPLSWVFEDKALQQGIVYEDGILVVVTFNKLSESYERFIFAKGTIIESKVEEIASRIEIEGLVGFNEQGEAEMTPSPTPPAENPDTTEPTQTPEDNPEDPAATPAASEGEGESM